MVIFESGNDAINFHEIQEQLSNYCFASFLLFFMSAGENGVYGTRRKGGRKSKA